MTKLKSNSNSNDLDKRTFVKIKMSSVITPPDSWKLKPDGSGLILDGISKNFIIFLRNNIY